MAVGAPQEEEATTINVLDGVSPTVMPLIDNDEKKPQDVAAAPTESIVSDVADFLTVLEQEEVASIGLGITNPTPIVSINEEKQKKKKKEFEGSVPLYQLWRYASRFDLFLVIVASVCSLGSGVLQPLVIVVLGGILNDFGGSTLFFSLTPKQIAAELASRNVDLAHQFMPTILKFVYFGIGILVSNYVSQALWVYTSEKLTREVRQRYVKAILRQDVGWHDQSLEGSLTTRLALDTQLIQDGIGEKFGSALTSLATFFAGFAIAFVNGWRLALVMFACLPILALIGMFLVYNIKKFTTRSQTVYAHAGTVVEQTLGGIRTVYAFSLQKRFADLYDARLVDAEKSDSERGVLFGFGAGLFFFALYSIYALAFWYGSRLVINGSMSGGDVMVVFFAMLIGAMSLIAVPTSLQATGSAQGAAFKIYGVIDRVPIIDNESTGGIKVDKLEGQIEFKEVNFHYPTRPGIPILKSLSLTIRPGQTVAFVGPSGSGKSTSVALAQRFYDAVSGQVLIDGKDIKDYNLNWLREQIGLVGQEPVLFNMSIKENILMGATSPITTEKLLEVCKMANCHNFIVNLPMGYDTQVGEHGGMMSGGQKQRIAIARALIKNPSILLLDEATSALDTASERIVQKSLDVAAKNRTTITIAHRLSTIRNADLICVMEHGVLIEQGTHTELYNQGGLYYQLVEKQKIAMREEDHEKDVGNEPETFVVGPSTILKKSDSVTVEVMENGLLSMPSGAQMTVSANLRRASEKKEVKQKRKEANFKAIRVVRMMKQDYWRLFWGVVGATIAGGTSPVFAYLLGREIITLLNPTKSTISPGPLLGANLYSFLFVMVGVATFVGFALQLVNFDRAGARLTRKLRNDTFRNLLRQEVGFYDEPGHSLGALTARLATDAADVTSMVSRAWGDIAQFAATVIIGLVLAFITAANLTGIILLMMPFAVYASYYRSKAMAGFESHTRKAYEEASEVAAEAIKEIRTVTALTRGSWFVDKYTASLDQPYRLGIKMAYRDSVGFALNGAISQFTSALAFYAGVRLIQGGHISFENLFVTLMVAMITSQSVGRSSTFAAALNKGKLAAINTFEFLDRVTSIDPNAPGFEPETFDPSFSFNNIAFTYPARPNQPIFTGKFNISGKENQTLALVGPSGCGKSTTIGMLERWYDCQAGEVFVGQSNVKQYQLKGGLRKHMALVGQEPVLFDMTIGENIRWGTDREGITDEEVIDAANQANIHKFISSLPQGYDTRVGDKGSQLSGGQKQRIAIARALIRKPKILLLDEATSALDSESEKIVQLAIDKASKGRTTITIAHRLSTIQNADQIAVVKDGEIAELGQHFELLSLNGIYAGLVRQQDLGIN